MSSQGGRTFRQTPGKENEPQTKNIHFMQTNAKWLSTEQIQLISTLLLILWLFETQYQQENKHRANSAESCYQHENGVTPEEDHRAETGRSLR